MDKITLQNHLEYWYDVFHSNFLNDIIKNQEEIDKIIDAFKILDRYNLKAFITTNPDNFNLSMEIKED